jgi:hypothetical protein
MHAVIVHSRAEHFQPLGIYIFLNHGGAWRWVEQLVPCDTLLVGQRRLAAGVSYSSPQRQSCSIMFDSLLRGPGTVRSMQHVACIKAFGDGLPWCFSTTLCVCSPHSYNQRAAHCTASDRGALLVPSPLVSSLVRATSKRSGGGAALRT